MSVAALQCEAAASLRSDASARLGALRVAGGVRAAFAAGEGGTRIATLAERDGYRMRLVRSADGLQGVIINTGGGVAGGDEVSIAMTAGRGADVLVTTQSAERIYRALPGTTTRTRVTLAAEAGALLTWMPQETILFEGASLARGIDAEIAADARLLVIEAIVLGRKAHGEALHGASLDDRWRLRRGGRLVLAENLRLGGDIAMRLARASVAEGAHVFGTAVYIAPDAEDRVDAVRALLAGAGCRMAASAWSGMLVVRGLAHETAPLRGALAALVPLLTGRAVPRVWQP